MKDYVKRFKVMIISGFLGLLLLPQSKVVAQDYLITAQGDTILGDVRGYALNEVKFRKVKDKKAEWLKASEIKELYDSNGQKTYAGKIPPGKTKAFLLTVLEKGRITLYENSFDWQSSTPAMAGTFHKSQKWYAAKDDSSLVEIKTNSIIGSQQQRRDNLKNLMQDNLQVLNKLLSLDDFSFKNVRELIKEYNLIK